jgi:sensitive to high expression protein 9
LRLYVKKSLLKVQPLHISFKVCAVLITTTEGLVKARLEAVQQAKDELEVARARESTSRKEVVGLLERKHAWSDADLERYMTLIRSEHLNDQGVQAAKDSVVAGEVSLEEARTRLEKRERMQYHEEQIWSDTIRRNSTWVTFGLMGLNIFLLLATLVIIEPWRRRRLVKEIRRTLEEKHAPVAISSLPIAADETHTIIEPKGVPVQAKEEPRIDDPVLTGSSSTTSLGQAEVFEMPLATSAPEADIVELPEAVTAVQTEASVTWSVDQCKKYVQEFFSEKSISMRKVDVTTVALEGFAAGAALMGFLIFMFRPR